MQLSIRKLIVNAIIKPCIQNVNQNIIQLQQFKRQQINSLQPLNFQKTGDPSSPVLFHMPIILFFLPRLMYEHQHNTDTDCPTDNIADCDRKHIVNHAADIQ